jgi:hypothetical protein
MLIDLLTYLCTEVRPSWEAANCAAIQEIPSDFKEPEGSSPCSQELIDILKNSEIVLILVNTYVFMPMNKVIIDHKLYTCLGWPAIINIGWWHRQKLECCRQWPSYTDSDKWER